MKKSRYDSTADVDLSLTNRLRRFPREPDLLVYAMRSLLALIIRALLRVYCRFEIVGRQNLRTNRALVLVANHCSHLDTVCLLAALPLRKLHRAFPAAASDYFFKSAPRLWIAAIIANAFPFARHTRQSLAVCADLLNDAGNVLIIFPEGTRSTTGRVQEFKSGIGALVAGRDVEVVPCFIDGAFRVWPKGSRFPRPRKVRLIIGAPRNFANAGKIDNGVIAAELRDAVICLCDE